MESVRVSLAVYALVGAATFATGLDGLSADPRLSMFFLVLGGLGMFVVSAVGVTLSTDRLSRSPPAWAIVTSTTSVVLFAAGVVLVVL